MRFRGKTGKSKIPPAGGIIPKGEKMKKIIFYVSRLSGLYLAVPLCHLKPDGAVPFN